MPSSLASSGERMSDDEVPPSDVVDEAMGEVPPDRVVDDADAAVDEAVDDEDVAVDEEPEADVDFGENIVELHDAPSPVPADPV